MKNETYPIALAGSRPYAKLVTYIQDESVEIDIPDRPLVLAEPMALPPTGRRNPWLSSFWPWDIMRPCCGIPWPRPRFPRPCASWPGAFA